MRVMLRLPDIPFSQHTIDAAHNAGFIVTRRDYFNMADEYIVVNHGSREGIAFGPRVRGRPIVLNSPTAVHLSTNKADMYERMAAEEVPVLPWQRVRTQDEVFGAVDDIGIPFVVKPVFGRQGEGVHIVTRIRDVLRTGVPLTGNDNIVQKYFPKDVEFRFNFVAGQLVQVSKKILPEEADQYPGIFDGWRSLGLATNLHKKAHKLAKKTADAFPELPSIAVDLMRQGNGDNAEYAVCEVNTGYGLGDMTAGRIFESIVAQHTSGQLARYRV